MTKAKKEMSEYMRKLGRKGGKATVAKKGSEYMRKLGRKGYKALVRKTATP